MLRSIQLMFFEAEVPSMEEEEVCKLMQECLAMRLKYIFQESLHPWQGVSSAADAIEEGTSISDSEPFHFVPEPASPVCV